MEPKHEEMAELLGAYALDAVDGPELAMIERHLEECPKCAAELVDHREVAAMLAYTGAPAPEGLWSRIVESLEEAPPAFDITRLGGSRAESAMAATATAAPVVDELAARRNRRPSWMTPAVGAVAAAAMVIGLVGGSVAARDSGPVESVDVALTLDSVAREVLNDPDASQVTLESPTDATLTAAAAVQSDGSGYLLGTSLPALDETQTYQLWAVREDAVISLGVLGHSPGVVAFHLGEGTTTLAITAEEAGGVTSSSNAPLLVGTLA